MTYEYRVMYLASWSGSGTEEDPYRANVPECEGWRDVTMQPIVNLLPAPNAVVFELFVTEAQYAALEQERILIEEVG